jgi:hypothetical protein
MVSNFIVSSTVDGQYITQELKEYRNLGLKQLGLPDIAIKAANAAVMKWGSSVGKGPVGH